MCIEEFVCVPKIICEHGIIMTFPFSLYILSLNAQDSTYQWGGKGFT